MIFNRKMLYENNNKYSKECQSVISKTQEEINKLTKKYQEEPDSFIKDYDKMIYENLIGILANWNANRFIRNDIISWINDLIRFRKEIINFNSNYCSSDNQK